MSDVTIEISGESVFIAAVMVFLILATQLCLWKAVQENDHRISELERKQDEHH